MFIYALAPDVFGRIALEVGWQAYPGELAYPDRLVAVAVFDHNVPQEDRARKVEAGKVGAALRGRLAKPVKHGRKYVEIRRSAGLVHALQEQYVIEVGEGTLGGGRERRAHYYRVRVCLFCPVVRYLEQRGVLLGAHRVASPLAYQVGFVPYLEELYFALVARHYSRDEVAVVLVVGGRTLREGDNVVTWYAGPHRRAVEAGDDLQSVVQALLNDIVVLCPGVYGVVGVTAVGEIAFTAYFNIVPPESLPHPLDARVLHHLHGLINFGSVYLFFKEDVDAQRVDVSIINGGIV